jgi:hypothetical protein
MQLDCSSGLLTSELVVSWCCLFLSGWLPRTGLHLLLPVASVTSLEREASFQPRRHNPQGNRHYAGAGRAFSIHGVVVTGVGEAPVLCLMGEGRPKPLFPLDVVRNSSVESSIMARHGD